MKVPKTKTAVAKVKTKSKRDERPYFFVYTNPKFKSKVLRRIEKLKCRGQSSYIHKLIEKDLKRSASK